MGQLKRFDLSKMVKEFKASCFFESGTFRGDGVEYALKTPFKKIISVEIIPEIASAAKTRFAGNSVVSIIQANSVDALKQTLPSVHTNIIFWLDAHFPGSDAGLTDYDSHKDEDLRLPLKEELLTIKNLRKRNSDVLILDDLRIYEDGPYENGNVPDDAKPAANRNIDFVYEIFAESHMIMKSYLDEGYLLLFPKSTYRLRNFSIKGLFIKQPENHYLVTKDPL